MVSMDSGADRAGVAEAAVEEETRRLTIDFQVGVEPLTGTLYAEGTSYPFAGWLSLATALGKVTAPATSHVGDQASAFTRISG